MSLTNKNIENTVDKNYKLYIGGKWIDSTEKSTIKAYNPSNGKFLSEFTDASNDDVDKAVDSAWKAFHEWKKVSREERSKILLKIADLIEENLEHLALVETLDNGKPLRETLNIDVPASADHFRYFAAAIRTEEGTAQDIDNSTLSIVLKEPIGVVGQVIPWNFPLLMAAWKIAPALAAGDTIVIHPSSSTSLSLLELVKTIGDVLPAGVLNLITGKGSKSGDYMLKHKGFSKLAFTGSTEIGYEVAKEAANKLIPATLELGGKSANIFFDDAPFEKAIEGAQLGILFNQGQVCCAGSRLFVQEGIYDKFLASLKEAFEKVKVGLPWDNETQMGAQVNHGQLEKILNYVDIGKKEGASLITGGYKVNEGELSSGEFIKPTILADATNTMRIAQEEIFGPVATVIKFKDEAEVIRLANESEYGLGGAVWTTNINRALRVAKAVETGRMWVNTYNQLPAGAPFGGYKKSGIGRETYKSILDAYTQTKNIFINISDDKIGLY
ncbi:putative aldehyde dehydrogenase AldA [Clostridium pasteurianum DSM 525 = ATCC 6013]|uniref:Aldehyde Dehydrogenase n=1 Tax=Clostridium pasteurianum DSM 525 = ATCC 6013 TaxID=1262449 RepID=A0A0H3J3E9_CLOPA|nr:aldehyde dehydrogenase family protein [Clostridium pasteurianum]AJA48446.1 putative aldehyde dehydrogenase AldA [Clostridium pasteurianum DSM 525 = ATCC 6013]AJA52434.1 putative aldehyde dehydrogenase AldA [Clostridium pasteurianum DSM 525 = ATCC 6013]AOZ75690.1 aldehyde dehydrogenase [Clostridium pasteurianum DSM 525 = ATCC 6013]AOZ79486.1 aldehyde dehydrogenase [Clostridium pasteurianum]ELP60404.1 aldehyde dehydrogenase [Clostridium pasteurianum DSM 525 = ATCC 6013]